MEEEQISFQTNSPIYTKKGHCSVIRCNVFSVYGYLPFADIKRRSDLTNRRFVKICPFLSAEPKLTTLRQDAKTLGEEAGKQLLTMIGMCKLETAEARSGLLPFLRCLFVEMPVELLCQILTVNQTGLFGDMCSVYEILLVIFSGQLPCVNHVDAEELFFGCDRFDQL